MKHIKDKLFADKGKKLYRKSDAFGPLTAVKLKFVKNGNGIVVPDGPENYEEREK